MPRTALALYLGFLAVAFGWRTWLQYRRTGDHGFRGLSGRFGSVQWWGGALLAVAIVLSLASPVADLLGLIPRLPISSRPINLIGVVLVLLGFVFTIAAQASMRSSWRIGVDEGEKTALVTGGLFAYVRNPIFTGMLFAAFGLVLLVPNLLSIAALVSALAGLEIQVRLTEEPYLLRAHGNAYRSYAQRVGRFLPGLGRLA